MGETAQAIEYLEFLQEDPPATEGIGLTHVLGYLALCFENKGSIYLVALQGNEAASQVTTISLLIYYNRYRILRHLWPISRGIFE